MVFVDAAVLRDPARLAAVDRARRILPALPIPLDAIAGLAARLTGAPMSLLTLVGDEHEHLAGSFGAPASLVSGGEMPPAYSVCKYLVSADAPVACADMLAEPEPEVGDHPLARDYGVRSFLGVPLRDVDDRPVGSLTVLDTVPRTWADADLSMLLEVAVLVDRVPTAAPRSGTVLLAALDTAEVLDAITEAFFTLDADGVITGWNTAAADLAGFTAAEACGQPAERLLRVEYAGRPVHEVLTQLLAGQSGGRIAGEVNLRHRDGRRLHARVRLSVLHGAGGAVVCVFLTDITDQVAAARSALAAAAEAGAEAETQRGFAEALLDSLDEGVVAVDATGRSVIFNPALRRLHGIPEGLSAADSRTAAVAHLCYLDGTPMPIADLTIAHALRGRTVRNVETLVREPDRTDRFMLASAQPVLGGDGQLIGAVCTVREVTERRHAEQFHDCQLAVARILARPGSLAELGTETLRVLGGVLGWPYLSLRLVEPTTDTLHRIAYWHPDGLDLADLLPDRLPRSAYDIPAAAWATGQSVWEPDLGSSPWMSDPAAKARAQAYAQHGLQAALSIPVLDGDQVVGVMTCFASSIEHDEFLLSGLLTDVANQIGQFLHRRQAEDLKAELARSRADFTALIGHDMRTPLTTIASYTQLLLEDPGPRPAIDLQLLNGIDRNALALRVLVDGLLDVAALEFDDDPLITGEVDLSDLLAQECAAADAADIALNARLEPGVRTTGDPDRLRQLIGKLLDTAIAANPGGGTVDVRLDAEGGAVRLTVSSPAAIGPPSDTFGRFSQANATGTGDTNAGVGLVLCRLIVERHGGGLSLTDDGLGGSTLTVRLPGPAG
jgi:PAS domain S-box-containing protein